MKVVIPGGTGHLGMLLAREFVARGEEVVVLSRRPTPAAWRVVAWDGETHGEWAREFDDADVVVNLAGRSVDCRYHARESARDHGVARDSTRAVGRAIARAATPPRVWLQASTATIYAHRCDAANDEATGILGGLEDDAPPTWRFSIDVARAWEQAACEVDLPRTRRVLLRIAIVMCAERGGAFDVLLRLVRLGLGGKHGDGRQFVSWIHERDFVRAVNWLIERDLSGPVNLSSPHPIPNAEFMHTLRKAWGARCGLPATRWMLELGAMLLRTETELVLKSLASCPES